MFQSGTCPPRAPESSRINTALSGQTTNSQNTLHLCNANKCDICDFKVRSDHVFVKQTMEISPLMRDRGFEDNESPQEGVQGGKIFDLFDLSAKSTEKEIPRSLTCSHPSVSHRSSHAEHETIVLRARISELQMQMSGSRPLPV